MINFKNIDVEEIKTCATPGASIGACIKEAMLLAVNEDKKVSLIHNEKEYVINPHDWCERIYKQHS